MKLNLPLTALLLVYIALSEGLAQSDVLRGGIFGEEVNFRNPEVFPREFAAEAYVHNETETTTSSKEILPGLVPDIIQTPASQTLNITYGDVVVNLGNEITPTQVKEIPKVSWKADPAKFYLLSMIDPDAPSYQTPLLRNFNHWMVANIPGNEIENGETQVEYISSGPPKGSGLHRYVFLLYEQPKKLTFDEAKLSSTEKIGMRAKFSIDKFAEKYELGKPIAANFYRSQWDSYVDILHAKLGPV